MNKPVLLEASAGTGKTFFIAHQVLELVVREGLPIERILVVTFTEAATAELRSRIRSRLSQSLREATPTREESERLRRALMDFDGAFITTIHGFCGSMLREFAFESRASFSPTLVADAGSLVQTVVEDFWARVMFEADPAMPAALEAGGFKVEHLSNLAHKVLDLELPVLPPGKLPELPDLNPWKAAFQKLYGLWASRRNEFLNLLVPPRFYLRKPPGGGHSYPVETTRSYALELRDLLKGRLKLEARIPPAYLHFTSEKARQALAQGELPDHPLFGAFDSYVREHQRAYAGVQEFLVDLKHQLIAEVRRRVPEQALKRNLRTHDQVLRELRDALLQNPKLGLDMARRFQAVLVDEFQDTDPVQWQIFRSFLGLPMWLIGDPKQAIYSFRGADLHAYHRVAELARRRDLDQNHRSQARLVSALNHLFSRAPRPFLNDKLAFKEVQAVRPGEPGRPPLRLRFLPRKGARTTDWGAINVFWVRDRLPGLVARDLLEELTAEQAASPGDCAVLVRTNLQAAQVQQALRELGIPSVIRSGNSVFASGEAVELLRVMAAVFEPLSSTRVKSALVTELMGRDAHQLVALENDERAWGEQVAAFGGWHRLWMDEGFIRMFETWMEDDGVTQRLVAYADGERRITNLLHLGELLHQAATREHRGPAGLMTWLQQGGPGIDEEVKNLRLESDAEAVQVMTVHRCKGLQFKRVWCPYLIEQSSLRDSDRLHLLFHDPEDEYRAKLHLGLERGDYFRFTTQERLEEDMRLLYVALTRAEQRCTVYWGAVAEREVALGYLLHQPAGNDDPKLAWERLRSDGSMLNDLKALAEHPDIELSQVDWKATTELRWKPATPATELRARPFSRSATLHDGWRRASFSSLVRGRAHGAPLEPLRVEADPAELCALAEFPAGAHTGNLLHKIFEVHDFQAEEKLADLVHQQLELFGFDVQEWGARLTEAVGEMLKTPLEERFALADLPASRRLNELEFYLPVQGGFESHRGQVTYQGLAGVFDLHQADYAELLRRLRFEPLRGFLHGFIDLVWEHQGRWYIADFKSNRLGPYYGDYTPERLTEAMHQADYVLQYHLYTLALHRYLGKRLKGYSYDRHFGGVYYLFLRGMKPSLGSTRGVYFDRPEASLIEALDELFEGPC